MMTTPANQGFITLTLNIPLSCVMGQEMATSFFNFPQTLDQILSTVQGLQTGLASLSSVVSSIQQEQANMATVVMDLQTSAARISADLKRAADMIMQLSQGHTVADADVEATVAGLNAAADAFDSANPMPGPAPQPGP
jgi:hypothetical protein